MRRYNLLLKYQYGNSKKIAKQKHPIQNAYAKALGFVPHLYNSFGWNTVQAQTK